MELCCYFVQYRHLILTPWDFPSHCCHYSSVAAAGPDECNNNSRYCLHSHSYGFRPLVNHHLLQELLLFRHNMIWSPRCFVAEYATAGPGISSAVADCCTLYAVGGQLCCCCYTSTRRHRENKNTFSKAFHMTTMTLPLNERMIG